MDQFDADKLDKKSAEEHHNIILDVSEEAVEMNVPKKKIFDNCDDFENPIVKMSKNYILKKVRSLIKQLSKLLNKNLS